MRRRTLTLIAAALAALMLTAPDAEAADGTVGYYRQPALHGETLVFVAEGDLWKVPAGGGVARRLTTHPGDEGSPAISPDGTTLAFAARYEGPTEIYTMPLNGGRPVRRTFGIGRSRVVGWADEDEILVSTRAYSGLPNTQLVRLKVTEGEAAGRPERIPLAQAADGTYDDGGERLFFTRLPFQGSHAKRYKGGMAQNIWSFGQGDAEAGPLTGDYPGTSKEPMWWQGRVYFASDRDGTMNIWSMLPDGGDLRRHTEHAGWDLKSPSLSQGRIAYQLGADIHLFDISSGRGSAVPIRLESDLDQTRERWITEPMEYLTAAHLSPEGDRIVLTARGRIFVAPHRQGRFVEATREEGIRYRAARFMPGGERIVALSDRTGEVEIWTLPADGLGEEEQLTRGGEVLRWEGVPSPDGRWIAHHDKNQRLFLYDTESGKDRKIDESEVFGFGDLAWSADSRWLAYVAGADNSFSQISLYDTVEDERIQATTDRFDSYSPAWSPDGKWLYFLTDRHLESIVRSVWGAYQQEPYLDKKTLVYQLALVPGLRSPFDPQDELQPDEEKEEGTEGESGKDAVETRIDADGLAARLHRVPVPPGNYSDLRVTGEALFWRSRPVGESSASLVGAPITNLDLEVETVAGEVRAYELSQDGKKILIRKGNELHIVDGKPSPATLDGKTKVDLSGWRLSVIPRREWRQMFVESWRLERDYFYDRGMHGVDWKGMLEKYLPLVDRVTSRAELSDLMAQMVSELAALHTTVRGGDMRSGPDDVRPSSLGALLARDETGGGYRVEHVYRSDPDDLEYRSPLAVQGVDVSDGDLIETINGTPVLSAPDIGALLRGLAGKQVRLRVRPGGEGESRDLIVRPITLQQERDLRYHEWEHTRRLMVEEEGDGQIGYVHLRAMSGSNFTEWAKAYYPVFDRKGLIVDVRNNRGGNIDSWIVARLFRKVWHYWSQRVGRTNFWNMQYGFRGHVAVLCNERTSSDGEIFAEAIKRLEIGRLFGTRTWGGEIWLTSSNRLVDRGIATAAEFGVYGPEGEWLIEGHGVDPDVVVDNLPHETFMGKDAQLEAAVAYLREKIKKEPVPDPVAPKHPDKSLRP